MKTKKTAGTPVSGPKHEVRPRFDDELGALYFKMNGWPVNARVDCLKISWLRLAGAILAGVPALLFLVFVSLGTLTSPYWLLPPIFLILVAVHLIGFHFRRVDEYQRCQTEWAGNSEIVSKLTLASRLLQLADAVRGFELGESNLREKRKEFGEQVYQFLIEIVEYRRRSLSRELDSLIIRIENDFGLLVSRREVFCVLESDHNPDQIEFVPKTFELPD